MLTSAQIRQQFIDFFVNRRGHVFTPSSPVVPHSDPTLLFTNAGMNQFKPIFLGQVDPTSDLATLTRASNSQKCIRAGGKHNDLDDVGKDFYHHTFFEMLGNWSFGDYFKKEAIEWAWELLTKEWEVDADRLYATYFGGDDTAGLAPDEESRDLWLRVLPPGRVLPGSMKDNFWEMGDTGPCGPCSEIHYDGRGDDKRVALPGRDLVNKDHGEVIELWNLVFIQFNRTEAGGDGLRPLPARHVDTGMGLERITRVLQGKRSNYDTDLFTPIFAKIQAITGAEAYAGQLEKPADIAYRVIADHIRTLVFAITDGADPSNEGRGYVLRRILRRAVRHGRQTLGASGTFLCELAPTVVEMMGGFFPELTKNPQRVIDVLRDEEESFGRTWQLGLAREQSLQKMRMAELKFVATQMAIHRDAIIKAQNMFTDMLVIPSSITSAFSTSVSKLLGSVSIAAREAMAVHTDELRDIAERTREAMVEIERFIEYVEHKAAPSDALIIKNNLEESPFPTTVELIRKLDSATKISAEDAFMLHDTYGFPIDLTRIMAEERGLTVDVAGFEKLMAEARERSRAGGGATGSTDTVSKLTTDAVASLQRMHVKATDDSAKYEPELRPIQATVRAIWNGSDFDENVEAAHTKPTDRFAVILDKTCLYANSGGQVGDVGRLSVTREARTSVHDKHAGGEMIVEDTRATAGHILHVGRVKKGEIRVGDTVELHLDKPRRKKIMANHTATHLLNLALRETLGDTVNQKGSLVAPDRLRFDFSHNQSVSLEEVERIERLVRERIALDLAVHVAETPLQKAKSIRGVRAVFGEKYPDPVRVVSIGAPIESLLEAPDNPDWRGYSVEFCGGTHLKSTRQIQAFALTDEEAVAKGVRRVVCLTGDSANEAIEAGVALRVRVEQASQFDGRALEDEVRAVLAKLDSATLPMIDKSLIRRAIAGLQASLKATHKATATAGREAAVEAARRAAGESEAPALIVEIPAGSDRQALLAAMDVVRARRPDAAILLFSVDSIQGKIIIAAKAPKQLIKAGLKAGDWVRVAAGACGGEGGGRPDSAQGGGTEIDKLAHAMEAARAFAQEKMNG